MSAFRSFQIDFEANTTLLRISFFPYYLLGARMILTAQTPAQLFCVVVL